MIKKLSNAGSLRTLLASGMLLAAGAASAATITVTPSVTSVEPNGTFTVVLGYTTDSATTNFNFVLNYDTALLNATGTSTTGAPFPNTCAANDAQGRVAVVTTSGTGTAIGGGNFCTITFDAGATEGTVNFTISNQNFTGSPGGDTLGTASVTIAQPAGPTLTAPANTTLNLGGGTIGNQVTGSIQYTAAGGDTGESTNLSCTAVAPATIVSGNNQTVATGSQPAAVVVGITLTNAAQSGSVTCNGTTFTVNADAGTPVTGPTFTAPAGGTTVNLGATSVGSEARGSIQYSAAGGNAGQTSNLTCTANAPATIVSGGNQNVATGSQPAPVVVGVVLGATAQTATVSCNAGGTVTVFNINAPAGIVFVPPTIVPASSLWSQFALIALFAALGGVFVSLRRNG